MLKKVSQILVFFLLVFLFTSCRTYNVTCEWQHNNPTAVKGFKIHCGKYSRQYTYTLDLGAVAPIQVVNGIGKYSLTQHISDRSFKQYRYCAMTAYNEKGESNYSVEVPWTAVGGLTVSKLNFSDVPQIGD